MSKETNLEKLLAMTDPIEMMEKAVEFGLPRHLGDNIIQLVMDVDKVAEEGGRTPIINKNHLTAGVEFQQGILLLFSWEGDEEPIGAFAITFDPTLTKVVGSHAYTKAEIATNFTKSKLNS